MNTRVQFGTLLVGVTSIDTPMAPEEDVSQLPIPSWMQPSGWFQVGWSAEIAPGDMLTAKCFGRDLIVYRTESGELNCMDARCLHLGAHLGKGGKVVGDCVVCPFHGWSWAPDGTNREIPDTTEVNRSKHIPTRPVYERNGVIYIWNDAQGRAPSWEVPDIFTELDDGDPCGPFHEPFPNAIGRYPHLTIQPRITVENIVDPAHVRYVHGAKRIPTIIDHEITPHTFRTQLRVPSRGRVASVSTDKPDTVTLMAWGVGVSLTRFAGRDNGFGIFAATPEDAEYCTLFQTIWVEAHPGESDESLAARRTAMLTTYTEDHPIWENQEFLDVPGLISTEAKLFGAVRKWCRTFEPVDEHNA
ncbi:MAG: aromatic ring-hydroxylating dioxygenase subunit alpha [Acidimicrobiia bacterium]